MTQPLHDGKHMRWFICTIWTVLHSIYDVETWTFRKLDEKHLEGFEVWAWRKLEKIRWTDPVKNEVPCRFKKEKFILHTIKFRSPNWIYINLSKIVLVKHVIEGKIEVTGRRRRILMQLLDELKEKRRFCKLKDEALDRTHWRTRFGGGYGFAYD